MKVPVLGFGPDAGCVQAVRTGLGVGGEPADCVGQVWPPDDEALGSTGQQDAGAAVVDRVAGRLDPLDRQWEVDQTLSRLQ